MSAAQSLAEMEHSDVLGRAKARLYAPSVSAIAKRGKHVERLERESVLTPKQLIGEWPDKTPIRVPQHFGRRLTPVQES